ncbi:hypothetical protein Fleli_3365 [Bernardetia litoralis DSM 6794]|uniref:Uncharacterized protein n=1 Tax=Bernardetia litoralis (strain ATCC 23117 / DSM 6794 / NBRC 15988 / NCIMB 1366 / Fx l1 / Sio-4) TaxID=880071 RepID=I4AP04_BERLS|nr:hypothetical protein [Bernardetia litoralis]AFM05689.1 hypothetical protein Fleli_3365 [Bernardetia litoralis DSM 6794]
MEKFKTEKPYSNLELRNIMLKLLEIKVLTEDEYNRIINDAYFSREKYYYQLAETLYLSEVKCCAFYNKKDIYRFEDKVSFYTSFIEKLITKFSKILKLKRLGNNIILTNGSKESQISIIGDVSKNIYSSLNYLLPKEKKVVEMYSNTDFVMMFFVLSEKQREIIYEERLIYFTSESYLEIEEWKNNSEPLF